MSIRIDCWCITCDEAIAEAQEANGDWLASLQRPFIVCPDCGNKRCPKAGYTSQPAARRAAITHQRRTGDRMATYWCADCHRWHLTTPTPRRNHRPRGTRPPHAVPPPVATLAELDAWMSAHRCRPQANQQHEETA